MDVNQKNAASQEQYSEYIKQFNPKPKYLTNCIKAFVVGGLICAGGHYLEDILMSGFHMDEKTARGAVLIILVCIAQLLTGLGVFDTIGRLTGAGVIVPITGFANSIVAPAMDYKSEGLVLGIGSKMFSIAGPVLVCGVSVATIIGIIYWAVEVFS